VNGVVAAEVRCLGFMLWFNKPSQSQHLVLTPVRKYYQVCVCRRPFS
jgi:hypothetical protein